MFLLIFIILFFCEFNFAYSDIEVLDRIACVVNEEVITLHDVNKALDSFVLVNPSYKEKLSQPEYKKSLQRNILEELITSELIKHELRKSGREVTNSNVESEINQLLKNNNITREQLIQTIKLQYDKPYDEYKEDLKRTMERQRIIGIFITPKISIKEEDQKTYYKKNYAKIVLVRLQTIFIKNEALVSENDLQKMQNLFKENSDPFSLKKEFGNFELDTSKDTGLLRIDELNDNFRKNIEKLNLGEIAIITTEKGKYLIKLIEKSQGEDKSYDEVKDEIKQKLLMEEGEKQIGIYLDELRRRSHIDIKL